MALTELQIKAIAKVAVKEAFFNYFLCRKNVTTQHILLHRFFPDECNIRSAIGGLETSLGITLWEKIAKKIATENNFVVLDPKIDFLQPSTLPDSIRNLLALHKELREGVDADIPIANYVAELNLLLLALTEDEIPTTFKTLTKGSGIDIYLKKGTDEYAFDLKTVQINAGSGTKFNDTLMKWLTFRAIHQKVNSTSHTFNAHIVIPYDPHVTSDWWTQFKDRAYPLDEKDLMLGNVFWDFLAGNENTLKSITEAFDELKSEGFHNIYRDCLHRSEPAVSIAIINNVSQVTCTTLPNNYPSSYGKRLTWECNTCSFEFKASIRWFLAERSCSSCMTRFFK